MARHHGGTVYSTPYFKILALLTISALLVFGFKTLVTPYQSPNVLGASAFIADNETDGQNNPQQVSDHAGQQATPEPTEPRQTPEPQQQEQQNNHQEVNLENLNKVEFQSENGHTQFHLEQGNSSIEISSEGGKLSIKAKEENGTEVQLQENSLDKINEALKNEDIGIATSSGKGLLIRKGQFEAETHFPVSINPTTNQLTVTTPAGVKTVAVLPDEAVNNLLKQKYIDSVASSSANTGIVLGLLNNEPAFQIQGVDNRNLFGLFPISVDKTSYVSAQNGQVLKVNQTFLSQLLSFLSTQQ